MHNLTSLEYATAPCIVYECEDYLVAFKPRCMHTDGLEDGTLSSWLLEAKPELSEVSVDAGLIQRLDFYTCGLLIAAKHTVAHGTLKNLLRTKRITKKYLALVEGVVEEEVNFTSYIGSPYRRAQKVRVYETAPPAKHRALEGTTKILPVSVNKTWSLIEAQAPLARRHQIRAHASFLKHPLIGDDMYGSTTNLKKITKSIDEGFFLFAYELVIPQFGTMDSQKITISPPDWLKSTSPVVSKKTSKK